MTDDSSLPVALKESASKLMDKLPVDSLKQMDELGGDWLRLRRFKNLVKITEDAAQFAEDRGVDTSRAKALALHVGLPWMERASLCEEGTLQGKWANLLLSLATDEQSEYDEGAVYIRILAELDPWDCKVLTFMVEHGGLSKHMFRQVDREELLEAIPGPETHPGKTIQSVEKLIRSGCLVAEDVHVSRGDGGVVIYGGIKRSVVLTLTGLNFHIAVSGDEPVWLGKEDNYRDDIYPVLGKANSKEEHERFVKLVREFGDTHIQLLQMAGDDLRVVRDYIRSVDGPPEAGVVLEGRDPHPVKPCLKAWQELCEHGLVYDVDPETHMTDHGYKLQNRTPLGIRFLRFISREDE